MASLPYEKTANLTWLIGLGSVLVMPDAVLGLLLGLTHVLFECAHLLFGLFESALDHFVEHTFHTRTRETQIIVFYIIFFMGLGGLYFLWRVTWFVFYKLKKLAVAAFVNQKNRFLRYWEESANNKFKLIAGFNVALTVMYLICF